MATTQLQAKPAVAALVGIAALLVTGCSTSSNPFNSANELDRTFIGDLEHNRHSMAIVRAVIGLGHSLNVPILAEGVETEAQHAFLLQEGCDEMQGYLKGRPLPIEDYAELVGREANAKKSYLVAVG